MTDGPRKDEVRLPGEVLGLGLNIVAAGFLFGYLGHWIGGKVGGADVLAVVGALLGALAGFYSLYVRLVVRPRDDGEKKSG
ncbi:MAG: AtpZ/AtpI family protein [Gemmatimonadota bacterium]|nr:AtpZ/AtpI family protein [Gemmatimonadota bacterium]MDH5760276.1 AtpZ/AtpI family protein [Gemmatimonadota bacterium]